jgi:hypothetical protein
MADLVFSALSVNLKLIQLQNYLFDQVTSFNETVSEILKRLFSIDLVLTDSYLVFSNTRERTVMVSNEGDFPTMHIEDESAYFYRRAGLTQDALYCIYERYDGSGFIYGAQINSQGELILTNNSPGNEEIRFTTATADANFNVTNHPTKFLRIYVQGENYFIPLFQET